MVKTKEIVPAHKTYCVQPSVPYHELLQLLGQSAFLLIYDHMVYTTGIIPSAVLNDFSPEEYK